MCRVKAVMYTGDYYEDADGYQVEHNGSIYNIARAKALQLYFQGKLTGCKYDAVTNELICSKRIHTINTSEAKLDANSTNEIVEWYDKSKQIKANHEKADKVMLKQGLTGEVYDISKLDNDIVMLNRVLINSTDKIVIPDFITRFNNAPLAYKEFTEVYVDNAPGVPFDASYLCAYMDSSKIKVRFKHPECVVNTSFMFSSCSLLKEVDMGDFDMRNVTNATCMFEACTLLEKINCSNWDTSNLEIMFGMFFTCIRLSDEGIYKLNTSKVLDMSSAFCNCRCLDLQRLLDSLDTSNVIIMRNAFSFCKVETGGRITLRNLNLSNVREFDNAFSNCINLEELDFTNENTYNIVSISGAFDRCEYLKRVTSDGANLSSLRDITYLLSGNKKLEIVELDKWILGDCELDARWMFSKCNNIKVLKLPEKIMKHVNL